MSEELKNIALRGIGKLPNLSRSLKASNPELDSDQMADQVWKNILAQEILDRGALEIEKWGRPIPQSATEDEPFCNPDAANLLSHAARERKWNLLSEGFLLLHRTQKLVHPVALPTMLSSLQGVYPEIPNSIDRLGHRAQWLAKQKESWIWLIDLIDPPNEPNSPNLIRLDHYIWKRYKDPAQANELLKNCWLDLDTPMRLKFVECMSRKPHSTDIPILDLSLSTRSSKLRQKALSILLILPNTLQAKATTNFVREILPDIWQGKKVSTLSNELPFKWSDVATHKSYFSNPIYRLISTVPPVIIEQTLNLAPKTFLESDTGAHRERLLQSFVLASTTHRYKRWLQELASFWYKTYPSDLTIGVDFVPALASLPSEFYNKMVSDILDNDLIFERLFVLGNKNPNYINLKNSREIVEKIFSQLQSDLRHNEKNYLTLWLDQCGNQLDPRVYPFFNSKWQDQQYYFMSVSKSLLKLGAELEERYNLYRAIVEQ